MGSTEPIPESARRVEHRSQNVTHETPPDILTRVRMVGPIVLDPATTRANPTGADFIRTAQCDPDGLDTLWYEFNGLTYVNPPYGRAYNRHWARKIAAEAKAGAEIIALVAARTGSLWWRDMWTADRICFVWGRLKFVGNKTGAPFDSALCYWGDRGKCFDRAMKDLGKLITP